MDIATTLLNSAAQAAADQPLVQQNRARLAAVLDAGYGALDFYAKAQPFLFVGGCLGALASGMALAKRRGVGEAYPLYLGAGLASAAVAWFTRPAALRAAVPPPAPGATPATARALAWVDGRVSANSQEHPGWEGVTWTRLANDLGQGTLSPAVQALLTRNAK
jgi:hypothetical protein